MRQILKKNCHLEVAHIDHVKSDQSGIQPDVCLRELVSSEVACVGQDLLHSVQSSKHLPHCLVIRLLLCGKASTIHSIIDAPGRENTRGSLFRLIRQTNIAGTAVAYTLSQVVLVLSFWNLFSSYSLVTCMDSYISL